MTLGRLELWDGQKGNNNQGVISTRYTVLYSVWCTMTMRFSDTEDSLCDQHEPHQVEVTVTSHSHIIIHSHHHRRRHGTTNVQTTSFSIPDKPSFPTFSTPKQGNLVVETVRTYHTTNAVTTDHGMATERCSDRQAQDDANEH